MANVSHINRLPSELLANVFELHQDSVFQSSQSLIKLSGVCKHWKDVSFGHPQLWTTLRCIIPATESPDCGALMPKSFIGSLKRWFRRAGSLPLTLSLTFNETIFERGLGNGCILQHYLTDCPSWRSLQLIRRNREETPWKWLALLMVATTQKYYWDGKPCWPLLENLWILSPRSKFALLPTGFPLRHIAPRIRSFEATFRWQDPTPDIIAALKDLPWEQLTDFQCGTVDDLENRPALILHILTNAPYLKHLAVGTINGGPSNSSLFSAAPSFQTPPPSIPSSRIIHHKLQHIHLRLKGDVMMLLLDRIRLPSLTLFEYCTFHHSRSSFIALEVAAQDTLFWPSLQCFMYDGGGINFVLVEQGRSNGQTDRFHGFKSRPLIWWDARKDRLVPRRDPSYNFPL